MPGLLLDTNIVYQVSGPERADFVAWVDRHGFQPVVSAVSLWEMEARIRTRPDLARQAQVFAADLPVRALPVKSLAEGNRSVATLICSVLNAGGAMGALGPRALAMKWGPHALKQRVATEAFRAEVADWLRVGTIDPRSADAARVGAVSDYVGKMLVDLSDAAPWHPNDTADLLIFLSLAAGDCLLTGDERFAARAKRALAGSGFASVLRARQPVNAASLARLRKGTNEIQLPPLLASSHVHRR